MGQHDLMIKNKALGRCNSIVLTSDTRLLSSIKIHNVSSDVTMSSKTLTFHSVREGL
jgi:hypothetical protein